MMGNSLVKSGVSIRMRRMLHSATLLGCLLILGGCGGDQVQVEGRSPAKGSVTLDGKPLLGGGTIKFQSVDNPRKRVSANLDGNGQFLVGDAPTGKVKMTVITTPEIYPEMTAIPKKYSKLKTSGLEGTIAADDEAFEVKLLSKP